jgi:hypothetical protein
MNLNGINDPAEIVSAMSMTLLKSFSVANDPAEIV